MTSPSKSKYDNGKLNDERYYHHGQHGNCGVCFRLRCPTYIMCQIDGCNKTPFAVCFSTGILICTKHASIRPRFKVLNTKKARKIYKEWRKDKVLSIPESYQTTKGEILYV